MPRISNVGGGSGGTSGGGTWGSITGTLSNQTDLQAALDVKVDKNSLITPSTKTKITFDAKGLVTSGSDATTADISDSTNKRYVTDAQLTVIGNTSGTNSGDETLDQARIKGDTFNGQVNLINDTSLNFKATGGGNDNSLKSGSDNNLLFDIGGTNSVKIKGGDASGTEGLSYTDSSWIDKWRVDTLGNSTQSGTIGASNLSGTNTGDVALSSPNSGLSLTGQTISLGTPSTVTGVTTNSVTTNTHTHAITGFEPTLTKGNLTAGSTKVSIGGTGTGALIGSGASVDINEANLTISNMTGTLAPSHGGTGIANNDVSTITISGNFPSILNVSGSTNVTLPTAGTLATLAGAEVFTNKTINDLSNYVDADAVHFKVLNNSGGTLTVGTPVYVTQWNAIFSAVEVAKAKADSSTTMPAVGLIEANIADGDIGEVRTYGVLGNLNTNTWSDGTPLYVSPTTAGTLTSTRPTGATQLVQRIATSVRQSATVGEVVIQGAGRSNDQQNAFTVTGQITSSLATGTSPFAITSTTANTNLNADMVDGLHATDLTTTGWVINETPSGTVNGSNTAFDTASTYVAGSILVYRDGQLMKGGGADYTETDNNTITFTTAPLTGSVLLVSYQHATSGTLNADTLDSFHANATPTANNIPVLDANNRLPSAGSPDPVTADAINARTTNHVTITPGTSKLVKIAVLEQDTSNANTYRNNAIILTGRKAITCASGAEFSEATVTFGVTFSTAPIVVMVQSALSTVFGSTNEEPFPFVNGAPSTTAFTGRLIARSGTWGGNRSAQFDWIAIGTLT